MVTFPKDQKQKTVATVPLPPVREARQRRVLPLWFLALTLGLATVAGIGGGWLGARLAGAGSTNQKMSRQVVTNESQLISSIAKDVGGSVVSVNVATQVTQTTIFGQNYTQDAQAAGTGVIVSDSGYVVTNRHVVDSSTKSVSVTLADGTTLTDVSVVGRTADTDSLDIAILKINDTKGKKLQPAVLGDSAQMQVGDKVIAIGNALGQFQNTVTSGIISGYGRSIQAGDRSGMQSETLQNLLQTDTAINSGNSGGPLVNMSGEVIGINTAVAGGSAENIGFAMPINDVKGVVQTVLKTGKFQRPYLGVRYVALTDAYAYQYNIGVKRGAYVAPSQGSAPAIIADSPAAKAGVQEKDTITKVDGVDIDERNSLTSLIGRRSVGDTVQLTIVRDGKTIVLDATLAAQ